MKNKLINYWISMDIETRIGVCFTMFIILPCMVLLTRDAILHGARM